jgi:hypothetical protein
MGPRPAAGALVMGQHRTIPEPPPLPTSLGSGKLPPTHPMNIAAGYSSLGAAIKGITAKRRSWEVFLPTSQRLVYPPEYGAMAGPRDFAWVTKFVLEELPFQLRVRVRICTEQPAPSDPATYQVVPATVQSLWGTHIASSWNGARFQVLNDWDEPVEEREVQFEVEWVADNSLFPKYKIKAQGSNFPDPPVPVAVSGTAGAAVKAAAASLNKQQLEKWQAEQKAKTQIAHPTHGTPHMLLWGTGDRAAVIHEFGHMLGLPDEYLTVQWNGQPVPSWYASAPFTLDSLMNNTDGNGGQRIYTRHYETIRRAWEDGRRIPRNSVRIVLRGSR